MPSRPTPSVIGKPMAKMFICCDTRETMPSTRFTKSSMVTMGRAIHSPSWNTCVPQVCGCRVRRKSKGSAETGKASKLLTSAMMMSRWPLITMKSQAITVPKKRPTAVPCPPVLGSKKPA